MTDGALCVRSLCFKIGRREGEDRLFPNYFVIRDADGVEMLLN